MLRWPGTKPTTLLLTTMPADWASAVAGFSLPENLHAVEFQQRSQRE